MYIAYWYFNEEIGISEVIGITNNFLGFFWSLGDRAGSQDRQSAVY